MSQRASVWCQLLISEVSSISTCNPKLPHSLLILGGVKSLSVMVLKKYVGSYLLILQKAFLFIFFLILISSQQAP